MMRRPFLLTLLLALCCCRAFAVSGTTPVGEPVVGTKSLLPVAVERLARSETAGNAGLFVGIGDFDRNANLTHLRFTVDDAVGLCHAFVVELGLIPADRAFLALGGAPSGEEATRQLAELLALGVHSVGATKTPLSDAVDEIATLPTRAEDMVIVTFSTHGFEDKGEPFVMPADGRRNHVRDSGISLVTIERTLRDSKAQKRVLLVDACRERSTGDTKGDAAMTAALRDALARAEGTANLYSADVGQQSWEAEDLGHGVYTYFLIEALRGAAPADTKGFIRLGAVSKYAAEQTTIWVRRQRKADQSPWSAGESARDIPLAISPGAKRRFADLEEKRVEARRQIAQAFAADSEMISSDLLGEVNKALKTWEGFALEGLATEIARLSAAGAADAGRAREYFARIAWPKLQKENAAAAFSGFIVQSAGPALPDALIRAISLYGGMAGRIDEKEARKLFLEARKSGDPRAEMWYARLVFGGRCGFIADKTDGAAIGGKAIDGIKAMANAGDVESAFLLGSNLIEGLAVEESGAQAANWLRSAANEGNVSAMENLAYLHRLGRGIEKSDLEAIKWYRKAISLGSIRVTNELGQMYLNGEGIEQADEEALKYFRMGADLGCANSMVNLGYMYGLGKGVERSDAEAVRYYRMAAELGHAVAMLNLGVKFEQGEGVEKSVIEAAKWYRAAAELGNGMAMSNIGTMYYEGSGVGQSDSEAVKWFRKAAGVGDASGMMKLGAMYVMGKGVEKSEVDGARYYRQAAGLGNPGAMSNLGIMYEQGTGVEKSAIEAAKLYRTAAELGDQVSMVQLGTLYFWGSGVEQSDREAAGWFQKASDAGEPAAMLKLAILYQTGRGVSKSDTEAARYYRKAADLGNTSAMINLGYMYQMGDGVDKSEVEAVKLYRKAVELGNTGGMVHLGYISLLGAEVPQSDGEAVRWFRKASDAGDAAGMVGLGNLYVEGKGVPRSDSEALRLFRAAAELGNSMAMTVLGERYRFGNGVERSATEAAGWYRKAADLGDAHAMVFLGMLYRNGDGVEQSDEEADRWTRKAESLGVTEEMVE
ncbi:hypothetical protein BH09SUM1_BH09SUM1_09640 [soil metagenome]